MATEAGPTFSWEELSSDEPYERLLDRTREYSTLSRTEAEKEHVTCLCCRIGGEWYALPADLVQRIIDGVPFTIVPGTPDFVLGVANVGGSIVACLDLNRFLGQSPTAVTDTPLMALVRSEGKEACIVVDEVVDVVEVPTDAVEASPSTVEPEQASFFEGVVRLLDDRPVALLDVGTLFASERIRALGKPGPGKEVDA